MNQWDIFLYPFPSETNPHPVVVISPERICANPQITHVNALACQTVRPVSRLPKENEIYLNSADGLDWKTVVKCDMILWLDKSYFLEIRGRVSPARIAEIRKKFRVFF